MVDDINPGTAWSFPGSMAAFDGAVFFAADNGVNGIELWTSDGTEAGTVMVRDIAPGSAHGGPAGLTAVGRFLLFSAVDGEHGRELWRSSELDTVAPVVSSDPSDITVDATDAGGATVTYAAPAATDDLDGDVPVTCLPASGATFSIGTTTVGCVARDLAGNEATVTFDVTVLGAADQMTDLADAVRSTTTSAGTKKSLLAKLDAAMAAIGAGDDSEACDELKAFVNQVKAQAGKKQISAGQAAALIADAEQISDVIGCE
jgi:ELWxxDGT repeat protein